MKNTSNYGLNKPETTDYYNVEYQNENMDVIDAKLKELDESASGAKTSVDAHVTSKENPHGVTKDQVGLSNVPNVSTNNQTPTYEVASSNAALVSGEKLNVAFGKIAKAINSLISHLANVGNPHGVTKAQVGLGNVDNTSDANKSVKYATSSGSATNDGSGNEIATTYAKASTVSGHTGNTSNPHKVTKSQVGLGNVDNTADADKSVKYAATAGSAPASDVSEWAKAETKPSYSKSEVGLSNVPNVATNDQTPTYSVASSNTALTSGEKLSVAFGKIAKAINTLISHISTSGTASVLGHVKLSDTYASKVSSGAAANGLAASQNALYNAYNTLLNKATELANNATVRFVNDESDENHTWVQVKDNDGTWKNWKQTYLGRYNLYVAGENAGQFTAFKGTSNAYTSAIKEPTVTFNNTLDVTLSSAATGAYTRGCVIMAQPIDLSDFSVLRFTFSGSTASTAQGSTAGTSAETGVSVFITSKKEEKMTPVAQQDFFKANISNKPSNEECVLDVSSLNGEYYVVFLMKAYDHSTVNVSIDNMYLE